MNKKSRRFLLLGGLLTAYLLVAAFLGYVLIKIPATYNDLEKEKIVSVQTDLAKILDETPSKNITEQLENLILTHHIDLVLYDDNHEIIYSTFPGTIIKDFNAFINDEPVLYKAQGKVETKSGNYIILYWIYHTKMIDYFDSQFTILNVSVMVLFVFICVIIFLMTKWLLDPLSAIKTALHKMQNYEFVKVDKANDALTMEFNEFSDKLEKNMKNVSEQYTELELLLLFEKEQLVFLNQTTRALVHELKTPLHQTMLENENLIEMKAIDRQTIIDYNLDRTELVMKKINELLTMLTTSNNTLDTKTEIFDLIALFDGIMTELTFFYQKNDVGFYADIPELLFVQMNKFVVQIIIHNLLLNAAQYAVPHSEVLFSVDTDTNHLILRCENEASEREIERILAGDQIVNIIENNRSGNGIYIIKELVTTLGGTYDLVIKNNLISINISLSYKDVRGDEQ